MPRKQAIEYTKDHIQRLPLVVAARVGRLWGLFKPGQTTAFDWWIEGRGRAPTWIGLFAYYAMIPFGIYGLVVMRRRRLPILPLLALVAIATFAAAITFGVTRYRAPAEVAIVLAAAVGIDAAWRRLRTPVPVATRMTTTTDRPRRDAAPRHAHRGGSSKASPRSASSRWCCASCGCSSLGVTSRCGATTTSTTGRRTRSPTGWASSTRCRGRPSVASTPPPRTLRSTRSTCRWCRCSAAPARWPTGWPRACSARGRSSSSASPGAASRASGPASSPRASPPSFRCSGSTTACSSPNRCTRSWSPQ